MIDLHTHTDQSDGSTAPADLVRQAVDLGLEALGITDHDTFGGFDAAAPLAREAGLELICGIELSTRLDSGCARGNGGKRRPSVHLMGYFLDGGPPEEFRAWILNWQEARRKRNDALVARLQTLGLDITLDEVHAVGRNLTGRPHFAQVLLKKGYVQTIQEAFDLYLADHAQASVHRDEPAITEGIRRIREAGGLPSIAHPKRLPESCDRGALRDFLCRLLPEGLEGIEVYYSDHTQQEVEMYLSLARELRLVPTGGSDYHGESKPSFRLGTGKNENLCLPYSLLSSMKKRESL